MQRALNAMCCHRTGGAESSENLKSHSAKISFLPVMVFWFLHSQMLSLSWRAQLYVVAAVGLVMSCLWVFCLYIAEACYFPTKMVLHHGVVIAILYVHHLSMQQPVPTTK